MTSLIADLDLAFKALSPRGSDWIAILPELGVAGLSLFALLQAMVVPERLRWLIPATARAGLALIAVMALAPEAAWRQLPETQLFGGLIRHNLPMDGVRMVFLASALLTSLMAGRFLTARGAGLADYHHVLLAVTASFMLLVQSDHFVPFFVSLEAAAVGLYVLVGYLRRSEASLEAGVKFLVAGGLSSAFLLMGMVLVYGTLGGPGGGDSLAFPVIAKALAAGKGTALTLAGVAMIMGGAAFKLGAFPFHSWIPDVYQGAPTPTTAYLATASKAAGALSLLLLVTGPFAPLAAKVAPALAGLALLTLLAGNLAALATSDIKRALALSGVSHAGFLLAAVTVAVARPEATAFNYSAENVVVLYLLAYVIGTFLTLHSLAGVPAAEDHRRPLISLRGLIRRSPSLTAGLCFGIGSLAGVPPSVGFVTKLLVLVLLVQAGLWWVLAAALIGVAVSIHYYFGILREAVVRPGEDREETAPLETGTVSRFIIGALSLGTLVAGAVMLAR
jgi:NADH-quinone oxidoreductase subunit N